MVNTNMKRMSLALAGLLMGGATVAMAQKINAAGATFPAAIYQKWFEEFHKLHSDIEINYQSIGCGGGIAQLTGGTVDFGASDMPMTDDQLSKLKVRAFHFPTVLGAVVPTYNIPGVSSDLKFTPETLSGIFLGTITKWNDARLVKDNPGIALPKDDRSEEHTSELQSPCN